MYFLILECHMQLKITCHTYRGKNQAAKDIEGRVPVSHYWDNNEPKLLCCVAKFQLPEVKKGPDAPTKPIMLDNVVSYCTIENE